MKRLTPLTVIILALMLVFGSVGCDKDSDNGTNNDDDGKTIVGTWVSTGNNVALLLNLIFAGNGGIDSVYADFGADQVYNVRQVNVDKTVLTYVGTYTSEKSGTGDIYKISITQTAPAAAIVEGIYEIDLSVTPHGMTYEVVQTDPPAGIAPTAAAGFGSTNGGALTPADANVQKYIRLQ
ncbi:MAG: hypothetical protein DWQ05_14905 [Calditrichaeota bacterium]|nr:MAG: hypothetical protein DWQ05_14905 [Calditrichota bacterium]